MKAVDETESDRQVAIDNIAIPQLILTPKDAPRETNDGSTWYHPPPQTPPKTAVKEQKFDFLEHNKRLSDDMVDQQPLHTMQQI